MIAESLLEHTALRIGAIEQCDVFVVHSLTAHQAAYFACHLLGLILVALRLKNAELLPHFFLRVYGFFDLVGVATDDAVGSIHNVLRRTIVALQLDELRRGILGGKLQDVVDVGATKSVDALRIVAHHTDGGVRAGELPDDGMLCRVGVLILVHQDVLKALAIMFTHLRLLTKQEIGVEQQIIEVHGIGLVATLAIGCIDVAHLGDVVDAVALVERCICCILFRKDEQILRLRNAVLHHRSLINLVVELHLFHQSLDERTAVGSVVDGEIGFISQMFALPTQDARKDGVKRSGPKIARSLCSHNLRNAVVHLTCRLVGESQCQDVPRHHSLLQKIGYLVSKHTRLARTGTGNDQRRTADVLHRFELRRIELGREVKHKY